MKRLVSIIITAIVMTITINVNGAINSKPEALITEQQTEDYVARQIKVIHHEVINKIQVIDAIARITPLIIGDKEKKEKIINHLQDAKSAFLKIDGIILKTIAALKNHTINTLSVEIWQTQIEEIEYEAIILLFEAIKLMEADILEIETE